jgi:hypothetical protein
LARAKQRSAGGQLYPSRSGHLLASAEGSVAVVSYHYQIARESYKKERETVHGRYTDVFVKDGGRWLFLAWTGGDDPKK